MDAQELWIGTSPDGSIEVVTFNPVETENEQATYARLGWKWVKFINSDLSTDDLE